MTTSERAWERFLADFDAALSQPLEVHCLGGFILIIVYGLTRTTKDLDAISVTPQEGLREAMARAGRGSPLHKRHGVFFDYVTVATVPDGYARRMSEVFAGRFSRLRLWALDPHDIALSKLERNSERDRDDVVGLALTAPLDTELLHARYRREVRPYLGHPERGDLTLQLWIEAIEEARATNS